MRPNIQIKFKMKIRLEQVETIRSREVKVIMKQKLKGRQRVQEVKFYGDERLTLVKS